MSEAHAGFSRRQCLYSLAATVTLASSVTAQQSQQTNIRDVTRFFVKPERTGDFRSIVKEFNAVFAKASYKVRGSFWRANTGAGEYGVVSYYPSIAKANERPAELREASAQLAPLRARLNQCVDRIERVIDEVMPDYSITSHTIPDLVRLTRQRVKPESIEPYLQLVKGELVPAVRKAEIPVFVYTRVRLGAPTSEFRMAIAMKSWEDLDQQPSPVAKAMGGQAAYDKFVARLRPHLVENEYNVYSHEKELDYNPSA